MTIQRLGSRVIREFQEHGAHGRNTFFRSINSCIEQVWHQAAFQLGEETGNVNRFIIISPRHPVRAASVQTAMAGHQAECEPALEHMNRSGVFETADIMAPEAEAGQSQR
ncbi:hypothetical protein D3C81_1935380 [compost metagenome]